MVRINFADVEEFEKLPKGRYNFTVSEYEVKEHGENSKHPGNDYWWLTLTVMDGEKQGKTQTMMITLPPYEPYALVGILRATVGQHEWTEEQVEAGEIDVEVDDLEGLEFSAQVQPQKDNPDFNNVRGFRPTQETDDSLLP